MQADPFLQQPTWTPPCFRCGAALPVLFGHLATHCERCRTPQPPNKVASWNAGTLPGPARLAPARQSLRIAIVTAFVLISILASVAAVYAILPSRRGSRSTPAVTSSAPPWSTGTAFALADRDGDGREDLVIGTCAQSPDRASFCAYRAEDYALAWQVADMPRKTAHHATFAAVIGKTALLVDATGVAHLAALDGGRVEARLNLGERADEVCVPKEHPGHAWLRLADGRSLLMNVSTHRATAVDRPPSCRTTDNVMMCMTLPASHRARRCSHTPMPEQIDNVLALSLVYDGAVGALQGVHRAGTSYPVVAVFDVGAAAPRFVRPLAEGSPLADTASGAHGALALAGNRLFAGHGDAVVAIDATTGKTLWRVHASSVVQLHASKTRVYLASWTALTILDAADGRTIGSISALNKQPR